LAASVIGQHLAPLIHSITPQDVWFGLVWFGLNWIKAHDATPHFHADFVASIYAPG
jgi:hypothetical protein